MLGVTRSRSECLEAENLDSDGRKTLAHDVPKDLVDQLIESLLAHFE